MLDTTSKVCLGFNTVNVILLESENFVSLKDSRTAICRIGLIIQFYLPGCPQAAPKNPGTLTALIWIKSSFKIRIRLATTENNNHELGDREITSETQQILTNVAQGITPIAEALPDITQIDTRYLNMSAKEYREHSLKDFLNRPIIIASSQDWSTTSTAATELASYQFPDVLLSNTMYQEKLKGFVGLRATLNVKVQVNSQPFQAGRLMLQYIPYAQYMPNRVSLINATLQGRSGCPRTDLDLSVGTEATLTIPYVSPHAFYNLVTGQGSFGTVYLVVYSPLSSVTSPDNVEYTVWAWLSDVEVEFPTGAPMITATVPSFAGHMAIEDTMLANNHSPSAGVGQIAAGLSTLSTIPVIGNMFSKPAWISAKTANLLKLFGWSKPSLKGMPCEVKLRGQTRMANYNGEDTSHKLALSVDNEIETQPGLAGTSKDEMALSHILTIPNYWDNFSWKTSTTSGILWQNWVTPMKIKSYSSTITDKFVTTHMGYVANTFGLWRGSIVYTFKFVKTQYHSGRLLISFIPGAYDVDGTSSSDTTKCYRMVVDLRESTEVSFTVPYIASRPWMPCVRPEASWLVSPTGSLAKQYACVTGLIQVEVLNQLRAASTVSDSIDVIVEVSGGPDLEFANPSCPSYVPYAGTFMAFDKRNTKGRQIKASEISVIHMKGNMFMGSNQAIPRNDAQQGKTPVSIGQETMKSNWSPQALCSGEMVTSVRQLIKRFGGLDSTISFDGSSPSWSIMPKSKIVLSPFTCRQPPTSSGNKRNYSPYEYWWLLFGFWRGSVRWKVIPTISNPAAISVDDPINCVQVAGYPVGSKNSNTNMNCKLYCSLQDSMNTLVTFFDNAATGSVFDNFVPGIAQEGLDASETSQTIIYNNLEGMLEFEVPYYNSTHISPAILSQDQTSDAGGGQLNWNDLLKGNIPPCAVTIQSETTPGASNVITYSFFRAAGDDFSFHYLLGVPPLTNLNRTINT